jgi:hypothetical protein
MPQSPSSIVVIIAVPASKSFNHGTHLLQKRRLGPRLAVGWRLASRTLDFSTLMDVVPLDATLIRGSHDRATDASADGPVFLSSERWLTPEGATAATAIKQLILAHVFE